MAGTPPGYQSPYQKRKRRKMGKNPDNVNAKHRAIVDRYYFLSDIKRIRWDDTLKRLHECFFMEERTIHAIVMRNDNYYREILKTSPTAEQLAKRHPEFNWK